MAARGEEDNVGERKRAKTRGQRSVGSTFRAHTDGHPVSALGQVLLEKAVQRRDARHFVEARHVHEDVARLFAIRWGISKV